MRFVVADDSPIPRDILRQILTTAGHQVVGAAKNGVDALRMVHEQKPDAVILDISMPGGMGDVAAVKMHEENLVKYIFVASSNSQDGIFKPLKERGIRCITKPFNAAQLEKAIREAFDGSNNGRAVIDVPSGSHRA